MQFIPDDETTMRIGDTEIPGVYSAREQGGGYTSEYIAQEIRQRAQATSNPLGSLRGSPTGDGTDNVGGGEGGGGGGTPIGGTGRGGTGQMGNQQYKTIRVPAGTRWSPPGGANVSGTLSNILLDTRASGATYQINLRGNFTMKNFGILGGYSRAGKTQPFTISGNGTIDNVYLGDGGPGSGSGTTGIFGMRDHSGTININNVNVQGFGDNGLYCSAPGNGSDHKAPGGQGRIRVTNSLSANNGISNFRLGTNGSYIENCVSIGGTHRGYWGYYHNTEIRNSDIVNGRIVIGEKLYANGRKATVTASNSRFGNVTKASGGNRLIGSSQGAPKATIPKGVPTSAAEAASGGGVT